MAGLISKEDAARRRELIDPTQAHHHAQPGDPYLFQQDPSVPLRPASAYTVPFTFVDRGPDNIVGSADDQNLTFYGIPSSQISGCSSSVTAPTPTCAFPTNQVLQNAAQDGTYKTFEVSLSKRQSHNYSLSAGFGYTWKHDFPLTFPNTPNGPSEYDYRDVGFKMNGTYNAKWGINISPVFRFQGGVNFARRVVIRRIDSRWCGARR